MWNAQATIPEFLPTHAIVIGLLKTFLFFLYREFLTFWEKKPRLISIFFSHNALPQTSWPFTVSTLFFLLLYGRMSFPQKLHKISYGIIKITEQWSKIYFPEDPTPVKCLWSAADSTEQRRFKSELVKI